MDWILYNARLEDDAPLMDVGIERGKIAALEPVERGLGAGAAHHLDLGGAVLLPGLVDAHTHLDKTFSTLQNESGTLAEALVVYPRLRAQRDADMVQQAARKAVRMAIANGVTAMRSHIDIAGEESLTAVAALLDLREQVRDQIELQFVALGEAAGLPEHRAGLVKALQMGVDYVGGAPALCADPQREVATLFEIAASMSKPIDLHIDETEDARMRTLAYLAEQTIRYGMQGRVTAGHCCSLAFMDGETADPLIDQVAAAQIHIVTLPSCNLVLMGRHLHPAPRGTTRVKALLTAGVNVCAASDNVHDPFNPFGNYDLLQIANLNAHVAHMSGLPELYESLQMVTQRAAHCLGLDDYGTGVGKTADLIIVDCQRVVDAVLTLPPRLATFKRGKLVVATEVKQTWFV